jgi:hypothetical protein
MTTRQLYEYALIEINKTEAPSLLLDDYNYFINKAVQSYVNKRYNVYNINQQTSDDLRVLVGTTYITDVEAKTGNPLQAACYIAELPQDYFHLLNCIVEYTTTRKFKCYASAEKVYFGCKRLTADMYSNIIHNYYAKPSYKNPYFYIHSDDQQDITSNNGTNEVPQPGDRDGNNEPVMIEIRYGTDNTLFPVTGIQIDYLRTPQWMSLTQDIIDSEEDDSATVEFPNYVCQEIIKELVTLLMENASDPRLNTNIPVNQNISDPLTQTQREQQMMAMQARRGGYN